MMLRISLLLLVVALMVDGRPSPHLFYPGRSLHPFQSGEWRMLRVCDKSTEVCYYKVDGAGGQTKIECFEQETSCTDLGYRWFPSQEVAKDIEDFDKMFDQAEDTGGKEGIGDMSGDSNTGDGKENEFDIGGVIETVIDGAKGISGMDEGKEVRKIDSEIGSGDGEETSEVIKSPEIIDEVLNSEGNEGLVDNILDIVTEATSILSNKKEETEEQIDDVVENVLESIDRTEHTKKADVGIVDDNHDNHKSKGIFEIFKEVVTEATNQATNIFIDSKKEIEDLFGNQVIPPEVSNIADIPITETPPFSVVGVIEKENELPTNGSEEMEEKMDKVMPSTIIDGEMNDRTENIRKESSNEIEIQENTVKTAIDEEKEDPMVDAPFENSTATEENEEGSGLDKEILLVKEEPELISNNADALESTGGIEQTTDAPEEKQENKLSVLEATIGNGGDFIFPEVSGDDEIYVSAELPNTANKETMEDPIVNNTNIIVFPEKQNTENEIINVDETINLIIDSEIPVNVLIEQPTIAIEENEVKLTNILAFPENETKTDEIDIELLPIDLSSLEEKTEVTNNTENNMDTNNDALLVTMLDTNSEAEDTLAEDDRNILSFPENVTNDLDLDLLPVDLSENMLNDYADLSAGENKVMNVDETINFVIDTVDLLKEEASTAVEQDKINDTNIPVFPKDKTKNNEVIIDLLPIDLSSLEEIAEVTTNTEINIENEIMNVDEAINLIIDSEISANVSVEEPSIALEDEVKLTNILALPEDKTKTDEISIELLPIDLSSLEEQIEVTTEININTNNDAVTVSMPETNSETEADAEALSEIFEEDLLVVFPENKTNKFDLDLLNKTNEFDLDLLNKTNELDLDLVPVDLDDDFSAGEDINEATSIPQEKIPDDANPNISIIKETLVPENSINISNLEDTNKINTKDILMTDGDVKKEGNNEILNKDLKGGNEVLNEVLVENPVLTVATLVTENPKNTMEAKTESPIKILTGYTNVVMANPGIIIGNTDSTGNVPKEDIGSTYETVTENFMSAIFNEDSIPLSNNLPSSEMLDENLSEKTTQENVISGVTQSNTEEITTMSEDVLTPSEEANKDMASTAVMEKVISEETTFADTTENKEVGSDITALTESAEAIIKELTALSKDIPENAEAISKATTKVLNLVEELTTLSDNIPENAEEISKATTEVMNLVIELHSLSNDFSNNEVNTVSDFTTVNIPKFEEEVVEIIDNNFYIDVDDISEVTKMDIKDTTTPFDNVDSSAEDVTTIATNEGEDIIEEIPILDKIIPEESVTKDLTTIFEETAWGEIETEVTTHTIHDITSTTTEGMADEGTAFTTNEIKQKEDSQENYDESIFDVNLNMYYPMKLKNTDEIVSISESKIKSTEKTQTINTNDTENVEEDMDIIKEINDKYKEKTQGTEYTQVELIEIPGGENKKKEEGIKIVDENTPTESILEEESVTFDSLPFPPQGWLVNDQDENSQTQTTNSKETVEDRTEKIELTDLKDSDLKSEEGNSPWVINIPILVEEMENNEVIKETVDTDKTHVDTANMKDSIQSISVVFPDSESQEVLP